MMSMFIKPMTFCIRFSFTSYILCFKFFFSDFWSSYLYFHRLLISVYILSTSTSPRNNTSVSYLIVFICPISIPTLLSRRRRRRRHPNSFRLHFPFHLLLVAIPDPTPPYHLNLVLQLPPVPLSPIAPRGRYDTTNLQYYTAYGVRRYTYFNFLFNTPFSIPPSATTLYHMCRLNLK